MHRHRREQVSRKLESFHCHLALHLLVLKKRLLAPLIVAFMAEWENRKGCTYIFTSDS